MFHRMSPRSVSLEVMLDVSDPLLACGYVEPVRESRNQDVWLAYEIGRGYGFGKFGVTHDSIFRELVDPTPAVSRVPRWVPGLRSRDTLDFKTTTEDEARITHLHTRN